MAREDGPTSDDSLSRDLATKFFMRSDLLRTGRSLRLSEPPLRLSEPSFSLVSDDTLSVLLLFPPSDEPFVPASGDLDFRLFPCSFVDLSFSGFGVFLSVSFTACATALRLGRALLPDAVDVLSVDMLLGSSELDCWS